VTPELRQQGLGGIEELRIIAGVFQRIPDRDQQFHAEPLLEEVRPQGRAVRIRIAEAAAAAFERAGGPLEERGHEVLEVVLLGEHQLFGPHRRALAPRDRLVGVVGRLDGVEQLVAGQGLDGQLDRRIAKPDEVVLDDQVAGAVGWLRGAGVGREHPVRVLEIHQVEVDAAVAAVVGQSVVGQRRAQAELGVRGQRGVGVGRDGLHDVGDAVAVVVGAVGTASAPVRVKWTRTAAPASDSASTSAGRSARAVLAASSARTAPRPVAVSAARLTTAGSNARGRSRRSSGWPRCRSRCRSPA
jgi:hypothetical protein